MALVRVAGTLSLSLVLFLKVALVELPPRVRTCSSWVIRLTGEGAGGAISGPRLTPMQLPRRLPDYVRGVDCPFTSIEEDG